MFDFVYKFYSNERCVTGGKDYSGYARVNEGIISFVALEKLNDATEGNSCIDYLMSDEESNNLKMAGIHIDKKFFSDVIKKNLQFRARVFSCTKALNNPMMWGQYAHSNMGFCVAYSVEDLKKIGYFGEVKYLSEPYRTELVPGFSDESVEAVEKLIDRICFEAITHKSSCWEPEKEYRAVYFVRDENIKHFDLNESTNMHLDACHDIEPRSKSIIAAEPYIPFNCKPRALYLGAQTPKNDGEGFVGEESLLKLATKYDIPVYKMKNVSTSYDLIPERYK